MRLRSLPSVLWLLPVAVVLAGCGRPAPVEEPLRAVKVMTVGAEGSSEPGELAGEVRARTESRLGFRVAGKLLERRVELGAHVAAGTVLARLDAADYRLGEQAAGAQVQAAQTNRDLAAAELRRFQGLHAQNFISAAELERREAAWRAAQAQWQQAQAQALAQTNQTAYTELRADAPGVVTSVEAEPGQVVSAGLPVIRLAYDGPRDVVFALPEDQLGRLRVGTGVQVRPWGQRADLPIAATVREVAASADPVTRTYAVKVALPPQAVLGLGSTAAVRLPAAAGAGPLPWSLPSSAVRQDGGTSAVWVVDAATMTVRSQPVQVVGARGTDVLVQQGLQGGMQVVTAGVHVLAPGQRVRIYQDFAATAPAQQASTAIKTVAPASAAR